MFKRLILTGAIVAALAVPMAASATSDNAATPGTPGDPNCKGQTTAYLAQWLKNNGYTAIGYPGGLRGAADTFYGGKDGLDAVVAAYCG